jgi:serine phosphatase RsbU (regulator of sigma subunit)
MALPKRTARTNRNSARRRLAQAALAGSKRTAAEMSRLLLEEVSAFCDSRFHDDATLLVIAAK